MTQSQTLLRFAALATLALCTVPLPLATVASFGDSAVLATSSGSAEIGLNCGNSPCPKLFGVDAQANSLVTVDPLTGAATTVGPLGFDIGSTGLDFDRKGRLWAVSNVGGTDTLLRINTATGKATIVNSLSQAIRGRSFTFGPSCDFGYATDGGVDLVRIAIPSGLVTTQQAGINLGTIARTPSGYFGLDPLTNSLVRFNPLTGTKSAPVASSLGTTGNGSTLGPDGAMYFSSGTSLTQVEPSLGEVTFVGMHATGSINIAGLAYGPR